MRLIDADALIDTLKESKYIIYHANATLPIIQNSEIERCISFVETAPTVEAEDRPHGKWDRGFCSVCGKRSLRTAQTGEIFGIEHTLFCKNCGADMRTKDGQICETMKGWWCRNENLH